MTYRDLQAILNHQLTPEQLNQDVSVAVIGSDGVEVVEVCDFVDPNDDHIFDNQDYRDSVYFDEIDGCVLDEGHPYMTVITQ